MTVMKHYKTRPDGKTLLFSVEHFREVSAGGSCNEVSGDDFE